MRPDSNLHRLPIRNICRGVKFQNKNQSYAPIVHTYYWMGRAYSGYTALIEYLMHAHFIMIGFTDRFESFIVLHVSLTLMLDQQVFF